MSMDNEGNLTWLGDDHLVELVEPCVLKICNALPTKIYRFNFIINNNMLHSHKQYLHDGSNPWETIPIVMADLDKPMNQFHQQLWKKNSKIAKLFVEQIECMPLKKIV